MVFLWSWIVRAFGTVIGFAIKLSVFITVASFFVTKIYEFCDAPRIADLKQRDYLRENINVLVPQSSGVPRDLVTRQLAAEALNSFLKDRSGNTDDSTSTAPEGFSETNEFYVTVENFGFRSLNLSNLNLRKFEFSGRNLKESVLTAAILDGVNLNGVDLSGAECAGANFKNADLSGANLEDSVLGKRIRLDGRYGNLIAELDNSTLTGVILKRAQLHGVVFDGLDLSCADFSGAELVGLPARTNGPLLPAASFRGATLVRAKFVGTVLKGVDFTGAELRGADFSGADCSGAIGLSLTTVRTDCAN